MINHKNSVTSNLKNIFPKHLAQSAFFFSWHMQTCQSFNTSLNAAPIPFQWQWHLLEVCPWFCTDGRLFFFYVWFIKTAQKTLLFTGITRKIHIIILIFMYLSHQSNHWRNWLSTKFEAALGTKYSRLWSWKKGPSHWQLSSYLCVNLTTDFSRHLLVDSTKSHHASSWFGLRMT